MIHEDLSFSRLKKKVKENLPSDSLRLKVALLGDFATQLFNKALVGAGKLHGIELSVYESDYDQVDLQILNPESELYTFKPDWVIVVHNNVSLKQKFYSSESKIDFAENYLAKLDGYSSVIEERLDAKLIVNNFSAEVDEVFGSFAYKVRESFAYQLNAINTGLTSFLRDSANAFLLDVAGRVSQEGFANSFDSRMAINASMPFQLDFLAKLAMDATKIIYNQSGRFAKCLILDLDNTTWGGIIGDDGLEGIQVGDLGLGKAFKHLQYWAKSLKERGVILAVCSKNEELTAKEPFEKHPEMVLRLEDISIFVANWESKAENIKYIQKVLNIGFDSMVFIDDNPMERDIVRQTLPEVVVPEMPEDPVEYMDYLRTLDLFSTVNYSANDKDRTKQYQEEAKRVKLQSSYGSIEDYLSSLDMEAEVGEFSDFYVPRIAQLTQRSNQFNPRTQRYSEADVKKIMSKDDYLSLYVVLKDKFGDYGLISNVVLKEEEDSLFIENWVMSCRVLKRQVEELVINCIFELAKQKGKHFVKAEYIPTKKNKLVKELYNKMGFESKEEGKYELGVMDYKMKSHEIKINRI